MRGSPTPESVDLALVPPHLRAAIDALLSGERVTVVDEGKVLGSLGFEPRVLEGSLITSYGHQEQSTRPRRSDVSVVATTMPLSASARSRLSDGLGDGYVVLDVNDAPASADVVLTHPVSPQLIAKLAADFPAARILVTEIEDEDAGVSYSGPVSRALDAGATAYLPPRPLDHVAQNVRAHLERDAHPALNAAARTARHSLEPGEPQG